MILTVMQKLTAKDMQSVLGLMYTSAKDNNRYFASDDKLAVKEFIADILAYNPLTLNYICKRIIL